MKISFVQEIHPIAIKQLQQNWGWFVGLGICLIILGILSVWYAYTATLISVLYLGYLLMLIGILEGIQAFKFKHWSNIFLHIFLSVLYLVGGGFTIFYPVPSAVNITLLIAMFLIISGIVKIVFSVTHTIAARGWLFIQGILACTLGALLWHQWPLSGLWALGVMLGINMLVSGWTLVTLGIAAKDYPDLSRR